MLKIKNKQKTVAIERMGPLIVFADFKTYYMTMEHHSICEACKENYESCPSFPTIQLCDGVLSCYEKTNKYVCYDAEINLTEIQENFGE